MTAPVGVALDVSALQVEGYADRGIGRYVSGYAAALHRAGALSAALLAPELAPPAGLPANLIPAGLARWDTISEARRLTGGHRPVAYHLTAPFLHSGPGEPAALGVVEHWARMGAPRVTLLHDLIPLRAPRHYLASDTARTRYRARAAWVGRSDLIVTNSEYTRREAIELLGAAPDRVVTIGAGVSDWFSPPDGTDGELFRFHFPHLEHRPFVLTVGGSDVRKGTDRAITALGLLRGRGYDLHLLVIGHLTDGWRADLLHAARAAGAADRVTLAGGVDDEVLRACYRRALVSLMPSLAEGAGLPILESAACATPALASGTTALAETAATPLALFDPTDVDSIADSMAAAVDDEGRRAAILGAQRALAAASTWDAVAGRAVAALEALAGASGPGGPGAAGGPGSAGSGPGRPDPPLRVAVVGEQPAPATAAIVGAEAAMEVTVVGPGAVAPAAFGPDVRPASFDHVVYVCGPSTPDWVAALAGRHPGWLLVPEGGEVPAVIADALVRRSRGVLVDGQAAAATVIRRLRPRAARPPTVVLGPGPGALARFLAGGAGGPGSAGDGTGGIGEAAGGIGEAAGGIGEAAWHYGGADGRGERQR